MAPILSDECSFFTQLVQNEVTFDDYIDALQQQDSRWGDDVLCEYRRHCAAGILFAHIEKADVAFAMAFQSHTNSHREGVATRSDRLSFLGRPIIRSLFSTTSPVTLTTNARKQPKCGMEVFVPFQQIYQMQLRSLLLILKLILPKRPWLSIWPSHSKRLQKKP